MKYPFEQHEPLYWPLRNAAAQKAPKPVDHLGDLFESILRELGEVDTNHAPGEEQPEWAGVWAP